MAANALERFRLTGVTVTDKVLGRGSFAEVFLADLKGAKCAAKRIHSVISEESVVRRFVEECTLLSELRHPNVVQFLGVHFDDASPNNAPLLVMEYLPTSLVKYMGEDGEQPRTLSYEANCYVFRDVAIALHYLHTRSPAVLHRDLTANNVLLFLTSRNRWCAKISDVGVARMLENETQALTQAPGTPAYMPPEAFVAQPNYTDTIDVFSFGILMIHALVGTCPVPSEATQFDPLTKQLVPLSEADRRKQYLDKLEENHPLLGLIHACISNDPNERPVASQIVDNLRVIIQPFELDEDVFTSVMSSDLSGLQPQSLKKYHTEVKQLQSKLQSLASDHEQQMNSLSISNEQLNSQMSDYRAQCDSLQTQLKQRIEHHEKELALYREKHERLRADNKEEIEVLRKRAKALESEISKLKEENSSLQFDIHSRDSALAEMTNEVALKEARINTMATELEAKNFDLERLTERVTHLNEQLRRATSFLATKPLVHAFNPQAKIEWEACSPLPVAMSCAQMVVIKGRVYIGGGEAAEVENSYKVFCFEPHNDVWNQLPADCPVRWFGLGEFEDQLVAVGGMRKDGIAPTNDIHVYDENSQTWKKLEIPEMPTSRHSCAVLSYKHQPTSQSLIVAGGNTGGNSTATVEVFQSDTKRWYTATPLPFNCCRLSTAFITGIWYISCRLVAGQRRSDRLISIAIESLIQSARVYDPNKALNDDMDDDGSHGIPDELMWKALTKTPLYKSAICSIGGSLFAVGGVDSITRLQNYVHVYSPAGNWIRMGGVPIPCVWTATAALSPLEMLVIGGKTTNQERTDSVHKATIVISQE